MDYVIGIKGDNKAGKTTFALTFPKPMVYFETDIGGYRRAAHRFDTSKISTKRFLAPIEDIQRKLSGEKGFKKGWRELWENFWQNYMEALVNPEVQTIVIDSFPQLYSISNECAHQEKEEKSGKIVERMMPLDYTPSYWRMQNLIYTARVNGKGLVLTHFLSDEYQDVIVKEGIASRKTGKKITAGWSKIDKELDLMLECWYDPQDKVSKAKIVLSGLARELLGQTITDPTWETLEALINVYRDMNTYAPR